MNNTRAGAVGVAVAVLLSLAGVVTSVWLLNKHVDLAVGHTGVSDPLCKDDGRWDCDAVLTSEWAYFPRGKQSEGRIPTALLGLFYFIATSTWFLIVGRPSGSRRKLHWIAVIMTLGGAAVAGYYDYIMWTKMPTFGELAAFGVGGHDGTLAGLRPICPYCLATHVIAGLLLIVTLLLWPRQRRLVIQAERVGTTDNYPMAVYLPMPPSPPARGLIAWVLTTAAICLGSHVGYFHHVAEGRAKAEATSLTGLRRDLDNARATADTARADAASARAELDRSTLALADYKRRVDEMAAATQHAEDSPERLRELQAQIAAAQAEAEASRQASKELEARLSDYESDYAAVFFNLMNEPVRDVPVTANDSIRGQPDAPHTVVLFTDLQCPHCQQAETIFREKLEKYPGRLRVVVKHFPLSKDCNQHVQGRTHPYACAAAVTAEAARALGGEDAYWKMYDELFARQGDFQKGALAFVKETCPRLGLDPDELMKRVNTYSAWDRVKAHIEEAHALGVDATPAVFFDGRKVAGWSNAKFWDYLMFLDKNGRLPAPGRATSAPASAPSGSRPPIHPPAIASGPAPR